MTDYRELLKTGTDLELIKTGIHYVALIKTADEHDLKIYKARLDAVLDELKSRGINEGIIKMRGL